MDDESRNSNRIQNVNALLMLAIRREDVVGAEEVKAMSNG